jgi:hypothetical protein
MANLIPEEGTRFSDPNKIESQIREYALVKNSLDSLEERAKGLRDKIFSYLDVEGDESSNGNRIFYFDSEIEGYSKIEKSGRRSRKIDELVAEEIIEAEGLGDELYKMVKTVDEEALMAALYEGKLTEEQVDLMYPIKTTWALRILKK